MKLKIIMTRFLLASFFIVLAACGAEFYLRVLDPIFFKGFFETDPDLGFRVRPHSPSFDGSTTNEYGFNDKDYPLEKTPGIYRVLFAGDSFSWAGGMNGNYTALLEKKLEDHYGGHRVDVINAGYPVTYVREQLAMLKKYGLKYNPDIVILSFFAGNDFLDAGSFGKKVIVHGGCIPEAPGHPLLSRSRLFLFLRLKYKILTKAWVAGAKSSASGAFPGPLPEKTFLDIEREQLEFFNVPAFRQKRFQGYIDDVFASLAEMNDLLRAKGIKFEVAIFPGEFQIDKKLMTQLADRYHLREEDFDLNLAQNLLKGFLSARGIPCLDFLNRFRSEEDKTDLYLLREIHLNQSGNQLAADILFDDFTEQWKVGNARR